MGRTHDVVISGFDLDALERERDEFRQTAFDAERELQRMEQLVAVKRSNNRRLDARNKRLERERDAERALADQLAEGLRKMVLYSEALILRIQDRSDINFKTLNEGIDLFNEWKEARSEI